MGNDTIANMITCIRNANLSKTKTVEVPSTHTTRSIAKILLQEGFIDSLRERQEKTARMIILTLKYQGRNKKRKESEVTLRLKYKTKNEVSKEREPQTK